MAGLSEALTDTEKAETTLPSWYTTAQQDVVNQAKSATAPTLGQTTGGQAALTAFGADSPFKQAASTLNAIATGAANPWTVSTGPGGTQTVSPNVATPLGGLFKAQTDYLTSMMPEISAGPTGRAIAGGGFGSSMNQAAVGRARSQAINQLLQQQNQAALQAQQTGANAAGALGTLGSNMLQGGLNLATAEMASPYATSINMANILAKLQNQPTSVNKSKQLGALNQLGALATLTPKVLDNVFGKGTSAEFQNWLKKKLPGFGGAGSGGAGGGGGTGSAGDVINDAVINDPNYDQPNYEQPDDDNWWLNWATGENNENYGFGYGDDDFIDYGEQFNF